MKTKQKIEKLTSEQEALMLVVRDEWINKLTNLEFNEEKAIKGINFIYGLANLKNPNIIIVDSPYGAQLAVFYTKIYLKIFAEIFKLKEASVRASVGDSVWASVRDSVWASVGASVRASVGDSVGASVRASVGDSVWDSVGDSVWDSVEASVEASVRASVRASVGASVRASVGDSVGKINLEYNSFSSYGNISDYGWNAFYDFFQRIGVGLTDKFNEFKNLIDAGVYDQIQMENYCFVSKLPNYIKRNSTNQMHSTTTSAIKYNDGYELFFVNGRSIEKSIFERTLRDDISFDEFVKIDNEDIKAGIVTIIKENKGNDGLLKFLNAEMVDEQTLVHENGRLEVTKLYKTKEKYSFLCDVNENFNQPYAWTSFSCPSTGQQYLIDTSAHFTSALESIKFHRPNGIPNELEYNWNQFAN